jgi:hypothetical protein
MSDGQPSLRGGRLIDARFGGLALIVLAQNARRQRTLYAFIAPGNSGWHYRCEYAVGPNEREFALSTDGRRFARRVTKFQLEVRDVGAASPPLLTTVRGRIHPRLSVGLGDCCLLIQAGQNSNIIRWDGSQLTVAYTPDPREAERRVRGLITAHAQSDLAERSYDPRRFVAGCHTAWLQALVDIFGHVVIFDSSSALVAIFHVFRSNVSVWLPDGTKWGPVTTIGGPPTPGAMGQVATALRAAVRSCPDGTIAARLARATE